MIRIGMIMLLPLLAACAQVERLALPKAQALPDHSWSLVAPPPGKTVNHRPWDRFLGRYVAQDAQGVNRVAYRQVTVADRMRLDGYLQGLQQVDPAQLTRDQQLAYWINLYNALTVDVVLDHYPIASLREITDGALSFGPWDRPLARVKGQALTLNDIEHRIVRPLYREPRIHYALNCAAAGCPNLVAHAWRAETLERDLAAVEYAYIHDPRGVRFDAQGRLVLSKIYVWFREDFTDSPSGVIAYLKSVADTDLRARLDRARRVSRYDYDWSLNDQAPSPK